jgi:hypothetical protein
MTLEGSAGGSVDDERLHSPGVREHVLLPSNDEDDSTRVSVVASGVEARPGLARIIEVVRVGGRFLECSSCRGDTDRLARQEGDSGAGALVHVSGAPSAGPGPARAAATAVEAAAAAAAPHVRGGAVSSASLIKAAVGPAGGPSGSTAIRLRTAGAHFTRIGHGKSSTSRAAPPGSRRVGVAIGPGASTTPTSHSEHIRRFRREVVTEKDEGASSAGAAIIGAVIASTPAPSERRGEVVAFSALADEDPELRFRRHLEGGLGEPARSADEGLTVVTARTGRTPKPHLHHDPGLAGVRTVIRLVFVAVVTLLTGLLDSVAAARGDGHYHTPLLGVARRRRALVVVSADGGRSRLAFGVHALVRFGTGAAVVAGEQIGGVGTARFDDATVIGARIAIVAVRLCAAQTRPVRASLARGAGISVVAWNLRERVHTTGSRFTGVVGARVVIAAGRGSLAEAPAALALIAESAGVSIVTGQDVRIEDAAHPLLAAVVGTRVSVVAGKRAFTRRAGTSQAPVVQGAWVPVCAGKVIVAVDATR